MKSTSGAHYLALDHVRALAALIVFTWHFLHSINGYPVPFSQAPVIFPLALLDEGHTGVALFMVLSGYLFSKLLSNKKIDYKKFLWNRGLRLLPLLLLVIVIRLFITAYSSINSDEITNYLLSIAEGLIAPSLPNGGWSITVEFHFYLILPLLLILLSKSRMTMGGILVAAIALRWLIYENYGEVQNLAYFTIVGRIDQFLLGMLAYHFGSSMRGRHFSMAMASVLFCAFYWKFDALGGFMRSPGYPSTNPIWIIMGTLEGLFFALFISWYDTSFKHSTGFASSMLAKVGEYSYSIYLLHMFFVFSAARFIHENIMDISNFYTALAWALVCFGLMLPIAGASYRIIEMPFMKWRRPYIRAIEY